MKLKNQFILLCITMLFVSSAFYSCKKEAVQQGPQISFLPNSTSFTIKVSDSVKIKATAVSGEAVTHSWKIGDDVVSVTDSFKYVFDKAGTYTIDYTGSNANGKTEQRFTVEVSAVTGTGNTAFANSLFEFVPAPGQFINTAPGDMKSAQGILGNQSGMVTLGAYGGYIVLGFDHAVSNKAGDDIQVYGNAFANWSEPGIVYVMADDNGNGQPDDTWYELKGSVYGTADYMRDYAITYYRPDSPDKDVAWKDNKGGSGVVKKNQFHSQAYYPEWITANSYTLKGSWLKSKVDRTNPSYVVSPAYGWGYADDIANNDGGGKVDISNAVDDKGNQVSLTSVRFIKIQTAVLADAGWLGEVSTEVTGVEDLNFGK